MRGLVLVFPGQGAQKVGMAADLRRNSEAAEALFREASSVLGVDLGGLCEFGPADDLKATLNAQPALYTASCATLEALRELVRVEPMAVAGHSVGEYAALFACGSVSFSDGLLLVRRRAELMQTAANETAGGMAAVIGLDAAAVCRCCDAVGDGVSIANYNSPGQVVVSGLSESVASVSVLCKQAGAKLVVPLAVSGGFHSALMARAGQDFGAALLSVPLRDPQIPMVANVTGEYCRTGDELRQLLSAQISSPVLWEQSMRRLIADGMTTMLELGAGSVLSGLMKRTDGSVRCACVEDGPSLGKAAEMLRTMLDEKGG